MKVIESKNGKKILTTRYPATFQKLTRICQEISAGTFELRPHLEAPILNQISYLEKMLDKQAKAQQEFVDLQTAYKACETIIDRVKQMQQPKGFWKWPNISKQDVLRLPSVANSWNEDGHFIACNRIYHFLKDLDIMRLLRRWVPPGSRSEFFFEFQIFDSEKNRKRINEYLKACDKKNELEQQLSQVSTNRSAFTHDINATFIDLERCQ